MQFPNIKGYGNINRSNIVKDNTERVTNPYYLSSLKCDTVSFGALKKSKFSGIDLLVVNKFKAPIEKFNSNGDLQNWCNEKIEEIIKTDYKGRRQETVIQRKAMLKEWVDYVQKENDAYKPAIQLLILDGITKNLEHDEDTLPPVLNKGILAQTVEEIQNKLKINPNTQINFSKQYQINLQKSMLQTESEEKIENKTGWVVIPSKENDPEHFEENIEKLKLLSHHNWCTKSFNAKPYLDKGDFHVYLEKGKPKLGIRFDGDEIQEIQGEKNNSKIPVKYLDIAKKQVAKYKLADKTKQEFEVAEKAKEKANEILRKLPQGIKNADSDEIFNAVGIKASKTDDGLLHISEYRQPDESLTFEDLGVDENRLLKDVKVIAGDADFKGSEIKELKTLQYINGNANFEHSLIENLNNLRYIGGDASFRGTKIKNMDNIQEIGRNADFSYSEITSLASLKNIGGDARFNDSKIKDMRNLQTIGRYAEFENSLIENLSNLQSIKYDANFRRTEQLKNLSNLQTIGFNANFQCSSVENLSSLKSIGFSADFGCSAVTNLDSLESIGGDADFRHVKIKSLGKLKTIGGDAYFGMSQITDLGDLEKIRGNAKFCESKITNLGNLRYIGKDAVFWLSQVTSLDNLEEIHGDANFWASKVIDLGKLSYIGGNANFSKSETTNLKDLKYIGKEITISPEQGELMQELKKRNFTNIKIVK